MEHPEIVSRRLLNQACEANVRLTILKIKAIQQRIISTSSNEETNSEECHIPSCVKCINLCRFVCNMCGDLQTCSRSPKIAFSSVDSDVKTIICEPCAYIYCDEDDTTYVITNV